MIGFCGHRVGLVRTNNNYALTDCWYCSTVSPGAVINIITDIMSLPKSFAIYHNLKQYS